MIQNLEVYFLLSHYGIDIVTFGTPGLEPASVVNNALSAACKALSILGVPDIAGNVLMNLFNSSLLSCLSCRSLNLRAIFAFSPYVIRPTRTPLGEISSSSMIELANADICVMLSGIVA